MSECWVKDEHHIAPDRSSPIRTALEDQAYRLDILRRLFLHGPDREVIARLAAWEDGAAASVASDVREAVVQLVDCAAVRAEDLDAWLAELEVEFTRLFVGPMAAPVQPYASVYLSPTKLIMSEETLAVRQIYLDAGLAPTALGRIPDDHLGVELDFLYFLTISATEACRLGDEDAEATSLAKRKAFVCTHFGLWVPELAALLGRAADQALLRGAAALLQAVVVELKA